MMDTDERPSAEYRFEDPVDILTTLDAVGIEHLEVSAERTIIIYDRTILDCEVTDGRLHDARMVAVDMVESPPNMDTDADSLTLVENLIEEITTIVEVNWNRL